MNQHKVKGTRKKREKNRIEEKGSTCCDKGVDYVHRLELEMLTLLGNRA